MQPAALKTPRKTLSDMVWLGGQNFQGRTKNFNTIAENWIKFSGGLDMSGPKNIHNVNRASQPFAWDQLLRLASHRVRLHNSHTSVSQYGSLT